MQETFRLFLDIIQLVIFKTPSMCMRTSFRPLVLCIKHWLDANGHANLKSSAFQLNSFCCPRPLSHN
jgi:hypothetical protein